ncbi:MAG: insulinase family protein [Sphingopyxis sp.]|jgi:predicted Zn-dependent peptidase|nr:insulinase family protein [Sphingopyxis sp.]
MRIIGLRLPAIITATVATLMIGGPATAQREDRAAAASSPASDRAVQQLVDRIAIPYERFVLDNGLTVIVHTDRKAPVVAVSVWYDVGSKHEPAGLTGFAHLFEHLMFNGSENAPGDYFTYMQDIGATDLNGTTNPDRTNYFQTVPTAALERTLFLEADRMGRLLGAVTQEKLDNQRGVVQNEKRQGDNNPFGLLRYYIFENLTPRGHPYHHSTIGSMADLNAASMETVQTWFRDHYAPNNAVLVLAGDIDVATARAMVERQFGSFARGREVVHPNVPIPTLPAPLAREVTDQIATTRIFRMWAVPGWMAEDTQALQIAGSVLGGLNSSRLDNALVRGEQIAISVSAGVQTFEDMGVFIISADVKPGVDPALVARRMDEVTAQFLAEGPTEDEVRRTVMSTLSGQISGLESVGGFGGKAVALAQGELFAGDPGYFRTQLRRFVSTTPAQVRDTASRWLSRPVFSLTYRPGPRTDTGDGRGGAVTDGADAAIAAAFAADPYRTPVSATERAMAAPAMLTQAPAPAMLTQAAAAQPAPTGSTETNLPETVTVTPERLPLPALGTSPDLDFPDIERATLRNGIRVVFARRTAVPLLRATISFDAGWAADSRERAGLQSLVLDLMEEATTTRDSRALAEAQERLGANISATGSADASSIGLYTLTSTVRESLALWADVIRNPAFEASELERLRAQRLAGIAAELNSPQGLGSRTLAPTLFGNAHPYGLVSANGTVGTVRAITRDDLVAFQQRWLRPDNATIYAVGDMQLRDLVRELNRALGDWRPAPGVARGTKDYSAAIPTQTPRVLLVNRPNSPQSVILAGQVLNVRGRDDTLTLRAANDVLGGNFLSRINMNLRETKGWSYGAGSGIGSNEDRVSFVVRAPVQADRTADSIREIQSDVRGFLGDRGVTADELSRTVNGSIRELPGSFETADAVLDGMISIVENGRPDNYYETLAARYRAMTAADLDAALRAQIDPARFVYIVVGDEAIVRPQLDGLGLPVETVDRATLGGQ